MNLRYPLFYIAPPLTFPLLLSFSLFPVPGRCFQHLGSDHLPILLSVPLSLRSFASTSVSLPSIFRKLAGMTLPSTLTLTVLQQRNTRLFPLLLLSLHLWHRMRPNLPFLPAASNTIVKPGDLLRWKERLVKDARLSRPLTQVMKIARLTSSLLDAPRQSSPRPRLSEAWQTTCSSLSPKSNPKSAYPLLYSVAGSSSSSPNFPKCSSPRESASVYAAYLRSHFSVSQPKALVAEPEATFLSSAESRARRSLTRPSALLFLPLNFLRLPPTFPPPLPLAQTKLPISC